MCVCRSPRTSASSSSRGGSPRNAPSAAPAARTGARERGRRPPRRERPGAAEPGHVLRRPRRPHELGAQLARFRHDELDRHALDRDAERPPRLALHDRHDLRAGLELLQHRLRLFGRHHHREPLRGIQPAARISGGNAAERLGDRLDQRTAPMEQQRPRRRLARLPRQRLEQLPLRLRPDPRHLPKAALARCLAQLLECPHAEHSPDLEHPLDRDAEEAAEPRQLGRDVALELLQLRDLAGLDELSKPPLDPGPDAAQLPHPALLDELRDRSRGRADQVGGAPVRPRGVRPGVGELEQRGERVQLARDRRRCPAVAPALRDSLSTACPPWSFPSAGRALNAASLRPPRTFGPPSRKRCSRTCSRPAAPLRRT